MEVGLIHEASGSGYIEQGKTKILCGVYGPKEIPKRSDFSMQSGILSCKMEEAPFSHPHKRLTKGRTDDSDSKELSTAIQQALEATVCMHLYPKTQIDIYITILENDGAVLAAALTCASMALANASIQMFDLTIGAAIKRSGDKRYTDPSLEEEGFENQEQSSCLTLGYQPSSEQTACLLHEGVVDSSTLSKDIEYLTGVCNDLLPNIQKCLMDSI